MPNSFFFCFYPFHYLSVLFNVYDSEENERHLGRLIWGKSIHIGCHETYVQGLSKVRRSNCRHKVFWTSNHMLKWREGWDFCRSSNHCDHSVGVSWIIHTRTITRSVLTTSSTQAATGVAQLGALPKPPTKESESCMIFFFNYPEVICKLHGSVSKRKSPCARNIDIYCILHQHHNTDAM